MPAEQTTAEVTTVMFTDAVASTAIKEMLGDMVYLRWKRRHDQLFRTVVGSIDKAQILKDTGDGFLAVFHTPSDAVNAALRFQHALWHEHWKPENHVNTATEILNKQTTSTRPWHDKPVRVRIGIHYGQVLAHHDEGSERIRDITGATVDFAARVEGTALHGQILMSEPTCEAARDFVKEHPPVEPGPTPILNWKDHGAYIFKDAGKTETLNEVGAIDIAPFAIPPGGKNVESVEQLKRRKRQAIRRTVIAALVVLAVLPAGWRLVQQLIPEPPPEIASADAKQKWTYLTSHYRAWAGQLQKHINDGTNVDTWAEDPLLGAIISRFKEIHNEDIRIDPKLIIPDVQGELSMIRISEEQRVDQGVKALNGIEVLLNSWEPITSYRDLKTRLADRSWHKPRELLDDVIVQVDTTRVIVKTDNTLPLQIVKGIDALLDSGSQFINALKDLDDKLTAIDGFNRDISKLIDSNRQEYSDLFQFEDEQENRNKLAALVQKVSGDPSPISFAGLASIKDNPLESPEAMTIVGVHQKLSQLHSYLQGWPNDEPTEADPRMENDLGAMIKEVAATINEKLIAKFDDKTARYFLDPLKSEVAKPHAQIKGLPWSNRHRRTIENGFVSINERLTSIRNSVTNRVAWNSQTPDTPDPRIAVRTLREKFETDLATLNALNPQEAEKQQAESTSINVRFDAFEQMQWINAFEAQVVQEAGELTGKLTAIEARVFEQIDPRRHWGADPDRMIDEIARAIPQLDEQELADTATLATFRKDHRQLQDQIESLKQQPWTHESRAAIEKQSTTYRNRLLSLHMKIDALLDVRQTWRPEDDIAMIDAAITALGTIEHESAAVLTQRKDALVDHIDSVKNKPWPIGKSDQRKIRDEVKDAKKDLDQIFNDANPLRAWTSGKPLNEISSTFDERAQLLQSAGLPLDAKLGAALESLQQEIERLGGSPWGRRGAKDLCEALTAAVKRLGNLSNRVDPTTIELKDIESGVARQIERLADQPAEVAGGLRVRFSSYRTNHKGVKNLDWSDSTQRVRIRKQMQQIVADLNTLYIDALRAQAQPDAESGKSVSQAWQVERDKLIESYRTGLLDFQGRADKLRAFLIDHQRSPLLPSGLSDGPMPDGMDRTLADRAVDNRREATLRQALESFQWQDDTPVIVDTAWPQQYQAWRKEAAALFKDMARIEAAIDQVYGLDEAAKDGVTVRQRFGHWKGQKIFASFKPSLQKTAGRIEKLEAIEKTWDRQKLAYWAIDTEQPEVCRGAWTKLGALDNPWPATTKELDEERAIRDKLARIIEILPAGLRLARLKTELALDGARRWQICFNSLTGEQDLATALELCEVFTGLGIGDITPLKQHLGQHKRHRYVNTLETWARFNILLYQFRRLNFSGDDHFARDVAKRFHATVDQLPNDFVKRDDVTLLMDKIRKLESGESQSAGAGFEKMGPSADWVPNAVQWELEMQDDLRVTYTWTARGQTVHRLTFLLIEPSTGDTQPCYLCTTEMSIGLFIDLIEASGTSDRVVPLMRVADIWSGPRVWAPVGNSLELADKWLWRHSNLEDVALYPSAIKPPVPAENDPIQRVSPYAAAFVARLIGCRLPASSEWWAATAKHTNRQRVNRRDATWEAQKRYLQETIEPVSRDFGWPDAGIFWPKKFKRRHKIKGRDATVATNDNDGTLWFDEVDAQDGTMRHLIGNVSEYAFDLVIDDDSVNAGPWSDQQIREWLFTNRDHLKVIGGSALSAPNVDPNEAYSVKARTENDLRKGYCDVGFRLAFTAPIEEFYRALRRTLDSQPLLFAATP